MANEDLGLSYPSAYKGRYVDSVSVSTHTDDTAQVEIILRALYDYTRFSRFGALEAGRTLTYGFHCEDDEGMSCKAAGGTPPPTFRPRRSRPGPGLALTPT